MPDWPRIIERWHAADAPSTIATEAGISRQTLYAGLRRHGIDTTKQGQRWQVACAYCAEVITLTRARYRVGGWHYCGTACRVAAGRTWEWTPRQQRMQVFVASLIAERDAASSEQGNESGEPGSLDAAGVRRRDSSALSDPDLRELDRAGMLRSRRRRWHGSV